MKSEKQKMLAGENYDPHDAELTRERTKCRDLLQALNATSEHQGEERLRIIAELHGKDTNVWLQPPFYCDYGTNITLGTNVYFNFNCVILDVAQVTIGDNVLFGPAVQIYTATHPVSASERKKGNRIGGTDHHRVGRLGRRRRHHLPRSEHRRQNRDRSRKCRHPGYSRRCGRSR